ncbi:unnamed protein product [[Candida] boidinii]|nr:unnamed protein product [[Candida] boidinii]
MQQIAESRNDYSSLFQNSLYLNSIEKKISLFIEVGLTPLAYATAKTNGLDDIAESILADSGLTADDIKLPEISTGSNTVPTAKTDGSKNWPLKDNKLSFFEQALLGNMEALTIDDSEEAADKEDETHDPFAEEN